MGRGRKRLSGALKEEGHKEKVEGKKIFGERERERCREKEPEFETEM